MVSRKEMADVPQRIPLVPPSTLLALWTMQNGGVDWQRLPRFTAFLLRYLATEPLSLVERLVCDQATARHTPQPPLFVVGHWRSGTSYLQTLLAHDPRFTTTTLYNTLFGDISTFTEPWLKPAMSAVARLLGLQHNLQRTPLHLDLAGEADVGLMCQMSPYAYTWGHIFPRTFDAWLDRCVLNPTPEYATGWLEDLDRYHRKLSWAADGRRVVLKSPGDTGRIALLAQHYPEARFVFLHRDPIATFYSNRHLWNVIRGEFSVQTLTDAEVDDTIIRTYTAVLRNYLAQRDGIGSRLIEIAYEDLRDDPLATLDLIYAALGLGEPPTTLPVEPAPTPRRYDADPALEQRLHEAWAFAFAEWSRTVA